MTLSFDNTQIAFSGKSGNDLNRSYWLFKMVSNRALVNFGKTATDIAVKLDLPVKWIIKPTIFKQFCGGETIEECEKVVEQLAKYNIGSILDYSIEGKESEEDFERCAQATIATIEKAKENKNIPFCVFKITGLARFELLEKVSAGQALNENEKTEYDLVKKRIDIICKRSFENNVCIFIGAEESWIQPAMDDIANEMMQQYNQKKAIVYNTYQLYRKDRLDYLKRTFEMAHSGNYFLGAKLVRGAYMEKERARAEKNSYPSPIQENKNDADKDYDLALKFCIDNIERIALCAGTHNEKSSIRLTELMKEKNIPANNPSVYFSQLFGMSDHISFNLANAGYNVAKYVPYGPVKDVLPYLIRRAQENTSIKGQTGRELSLIIKEKNRRKGS